jgi:hypothetical protein
VGCGGVIGSCYWGDSRQMLCFPGLLNFSHTRRSESGGWECRCGNSDSAKQGLRFRSFSDLYQTNTNSSQPRQVLVWGTYY